MRGVKIEIGSTSYLVALLASEYYVELLVFDDEKSKIISGSIKWDGCSNLLSHEVIHFCGYKSIDEFGKLLKALHYLADTSMLRSEENLPYPDGVDFLNIEVETLENDTENLSNAEKILSALT